MPHRFNHLNGNNGVIRTIIDIAVVLQAQVGAAGDSQALHAGLGELQLLRAECYPDDAGAELGGGFFCQGAPAAADFQNPVTRFDVGQR